MTLPVNHSQIIISKCVTAILWFNAVLIVGGLSGLLFAFLAESLNIDLSGFTSAALWESLKIWLIINICLLSVLNAIYLSVTVANVSLKGRRLGVWCGLICFAAWMAVWVYSLYLLVLFFFAHAIDGQWVIIGHFALFAIAAFAINAALIKRKVCLL
jgi:hypothetical protein